MTRPRPPRPESGARERAGLADPKACWQAALAALNRREHARAELARKLSQKGFEEADVESAIERLVELGWLSDQRYAGALARTRAASGQGPGRIQAELARHGIDAESADEALASCEVDWSVRARELVVKRFGQAPLRGQPNERRALAFLLRRGFDIGTARAAMRDSSD